MQNTKSLVQKCKDTIESSRTIEQLETAMKFTNLAKKQLSPDDRDDLRYAGFWQMIRLIKAH